LASKLIKTWTECIGFRLFSVKLSPTCWFEPTGFHNSVHKFQNLPTSKSQIWHLSTFLLSWTSPNSASNIAKNSSDHDRFAVVQNFSDFLYKLAFFNSIWIHCWLFPCKQIIGLQILNNHFSILVLIIQSYTMQWNFIQFQSWPFLLKFQT